MEYPTGFHFYTTTHMPSLLQNEVIRKVKVRNVVATGKTEFNFTNRGRFETAVAREIYIMPEGA